MYLKLVSITIKVEMRLCLVGRRIVRRSPDTVGARFYSLHPHICSFFEEYSNDVTYILILLYILIIFCRDKLMSLIDDKQILRFSTNPKFTNHINTKETKLSILHT